MYTCHVCGKPTPNYCEWSPSLAAILGEQGQSTCDECRRKSYILHKWENEQFAEERLICPYCEISISDPWEYDEGEDEIECPACGHAFEVEITTVRTYRTRRRMEDMPDGWDGGSFDELQFLQHDGRSGHRRSAPRRGKGCGGYGSHAVWRWRIRYSYRIGRKCDGLGLEHVGVRR